MCLEKNNSETVLIIIIYLIVIITYILINIWFLVCCVALFLLHSVITYFDARIKILLYRSSLIQQQYLCQWLTSSTQCLYPILRVSYVTAGHVQALGWKRYWLSSSLVPDPSWSLQRPSLLAHHTTDSFHWLRAHRLVQHAMEIPERRRVADAYIQLPHQFWHRIHFASFRRSWYHAGNTSQCRCRLCFQ